MGQLSSVDEFFLSQGDSPPQWYNFWGQCQQSLGMAMQEICSHNIFMETQRKALQWQPQTALFSMFIRSQKIGDQGNPPLSPNAGIISVYILYRRLPAPQPRAGCLTFLTFRLLILKIGYYILLGSSKSTYVSCLAHMGGSVNVCTPITVGK